jgi:three-Cys-motif partner protein
LVADAARIASDGLPAIEVGGWAREKHDRLERYVDISRGVRAKFIGRAGATYIDLFCGPGRSFIRDTVQEIPGSPVVAAEKAAASNTPFSEVHIADIDREATSAATERVSKICRSVFAETGSAEETVKAIANRLNPHALHFAFLDPYKMELPFTIIERLAAFKHMDMLIHVSSQDFQRNLELYMREQDGPLDRFAPGWRSVVDINHPQQSAKRQAIFNHWLSLIRKLDMAPAEGIESVYGNHGQRLYWLVFVARHPRAREFWDKIRNVTSQGRLL